MHYTLTPGNDGFRAALTGRFTFQDHALFRGLVGAIAAAPGGQVTLNLGGLDFIDSAGLGMLLVAHTASKKAGCAFVVEQPKGQVLRTLEIAAMGSIFTIAA